MQTEASVLNQLRFAYELLADILAQAPQLYDCHLDQALLLLVLAMKRAQRSPKLRRPPPPAYPVQETLFRRSGARRVPQQHPSDIRAPGESYIYSKPAAAPVFIALGLQRGARRTLGKRLPGAL